MANFQTPLYLQLESHLDVWVLNRPFAYTTDIDPAKYGHADLSKELVTPGNMRTDLASVKLGRLLFPPNEPTYAMAAVIHDFLCRPATAVSRKFADAVFFEALTVCNLPRWKCWLMYGYVRIGHLITGQG